MGGVRDEQKARESKRRRDTELDAAKTVEQRFWMMNSLSIFAAQVRQSVGP